MKAEQLPGEEGPTFTRTIRGERAIKEVVSNFLERAARPPGQGSKNEEAFAYGISDKWSTFRVEADTGYYSKLLEKNPALKILTVTDIQPDNLEGVKKLLNAGLEIRHLADNKIRLSVSKDEYLETTQGRAPLGTADELVWSNDPQVIAVATRIFRVLWNQAIPAQVRIAEIEHNATPESIKVITDPSDIMKKYLELISSAANEIDAIFPTQRAFRREEKAGLIHEIESAAAHRGVKVRIISPLDYEIAAKVRNRGWRRAAIRSGSAKSEIQLREIDVAKTETKVTIMIIDGVESLVIELKDDTREELIDAIGLATYSNSRATVSSYIAFFGKIWHEAELRESESRAREAMEEALLREEKASREARLLQDILSHDIRTTIRSYASGLS